MGTYLLLDLQLVLRLKELQFWLAASFDHWLRHGQQCLEQVSPRGRTRLLVVIVILRSTLAQLGLRVRLRLASIGGCLLARRPIRLHDPVLCVVDADDESLVLLIARHVVRLIERLLTLRPDRLGSLLKVNDNRVVLRIQIVILDATPDGLHIHDISQLILGHLTTVACQCSFTHLYFLRLVVEDDGADFASRQKNHAHGYSEREDAVLLPLVHYQQMLVQGDSNHN